MQKSLLTLLTLAAFSSPALATLTFYDPFDYAGDGSSLSGQTDMSFSPNQQWFRAGSGTNDPKTTAGNLSYPSLATSTGNSVLLNNTNAGSTISRVDIQPYVGPAAGDPAVNVYYSMLLHVTDLTGLTNSTTGSFLAGLQYYYPEAANPSNDGLTANSATSAGALTIHADASGTGYNLGVAVRDAPAAATRVFDTTAYGTSDTLLVVVKYVIGSGNKDDGAYLYINPPSSSFGGTEPASATVSSLSANAASEYDYFYNNTTGVQLVDSGGVTVNSLRSFFLRNNSVEPMNIQIDDVRVGTTWADVTPAAFVHLTGDTNNDGVVDLTDLNNVLNNFGVSATGNPGDDNGDGTVDLTDLNDVLNNFGTHSPAASGLSVVPEPASLSLLAVGATALLARRRRNWATI